MHLAYTSVGHSQSKSPDTPEVFVVDGDAAHRGAMETLIRGAGWRPTSAVSAEEFLAHPRASRPSCLLVELHLPGMSGLDLQRLVLDRTEMPVIFVCGRADVQATVQAMKAGAFEFLTKPFVGEILTDAIARALECSYVMLDRVARNQALQQRYESLSRREREVMSLVVAGRLNKQVGGQLGISEITVKAHRGRVMQKMQAGSLAELVKMIASLSGASALTDPYLRSFAS